MKHLCLTGLVVCAWIAGYCQGGNRMSEILRPEITCREIGEQLREIQPKLDACEKAVALLPKDPQDTYLSIDESRRIKHPYWIYPAEYTDNNAYNPWEFLNANQ